MKTKLIGITLFTLTLATVAVYPSIKSDRPTVNPPIATSVQFETTPVIDLVFVLDTTGSIHESTAKLTTKGTRSHNTKTMVWLWSKRG